MVDPTSSQSSAPKRACDACHRRKVRCVPVLDDSTSTGHQSNCKNCRSSNLACTYDAVPQKKGPKGSRAKVITELRERQRRDSISSTFRDSSTPPGSPSLSRTSNTISQELVDACIDYFFENVYPTQPILERDSLRESVSTMYQDAQSYCMIVSLCAYMLIQPHIDLPASIINGPEIVGSTSALGAILLRDVLEVRRAFDPYENPNIQSVRTSFFLFGSYFCLEKHSTAWAYLRDSTTVALLLGMHQESTYASLTPLEADLRRRLYWLLYVTERAYSIQAQRPLTLYDTIAMPDIEEEDRGEQTDQLMGFIHLIQLYKPFDHTFVGLWNQSIEHGTTADWICNLQRQLAEALPQYLRSTEIQAVDLKTSQQWLRVMIWQLSISHKLLSSNASDEAMTFKFPLELSRQLSEQTTGYSTHNMEVHGIGLVKKLFDVACTLVDVMSCVPMNPPHGFEIGPREYLEHFLSLMSKLRGGRERYLPMLLTKMNESLPPGSIPRGLPSSTMVGSTPVNLDALDFPESGSEFSVPTLKSEYSNLSGSMAPDMTETPPFVSTFTDDEDSPMEDGPYTLRSQSSYPTC